MIKINEKILEQKFFPDGTPLIQFDFESVVKEIECGAPCLQNRSSEKRVEVTWIYDNMNELFTVQCIVEHIQNLYQEIKIELIIPYIPNARQDRQKNMINDVFTLRTFCNQINAMNVNAVFAVDVHSTVTPALIKRLIVDERKLKNFIETAIDHASIESNDEILLFYPDEGAYKKYFELFPDRPYAFGIKKRDWSTGQIESLSTHGENVHGKTILIVDDICSYGGSFYRAAKELKVDGAKNIYLYVTHCEPNILKGDIFNEERLIEKVFTTNSIFRNTPHGDKKTDYEKDKPTTRNRFL
jgi:ribose-phosphate pyrophosphokinase